MFSALGLAQDRTPTGQSVPPIFATAVRDIAPAAQPGSWVIQIVSRGGITGRGTGDVVVRSEGTLALSEPAAAKPSAGAQPIGPDLMRPLHERVQAALPSQWTGSHLSSTCSDCDVTLMVIARRDANGAVRTHTAFWDAITKRGVPAEVLRIYEAALTLK